jgi:hypothetical protein
MGETIWWYDRDADGYGDPTLTPITSCAQPAYTVDNSDDCDDQDVLISPVADELCDGVDNDCDGAIDDADADLDDTLEVWDDDDFDGYGDVGSASRIVAVCVPPSGFSLSHDDCNDSNNAISPSQNDVCSSIDENCDGTLNDLGMDIYEPNETRLTACGIVDGVSGCSAVSTATYVHNSVVSGIHLETAGDEDWFEWYVDDHSTDAIQTITINSPFDVSYEIFVYDDAAHQWSNKPAGSGSGTFLINGLNASKINQEHWRLKLSVGTQTPLYTTTDCSDSITLTITEPL